MDWKVIGERVAASVMIGAMVGVAVWGLPLIPLPIAIGLVASVLVFVADTVTT